MDVSALLECDDVSRDLSTGKLSITPCFASIKLDSSVESSASLYPFLSR